MANQVYANSMEISCKSADGKTICAMPDTCFTPPENPATPPGVPIPYPNTGMAKDTTEGSRTVQISSKEVMLKNKSYFKQSYGDEAGCAAKKGVITSVNRGKVYFVAWSMDVKMEDENVVRHLDMTTHNHACPIANEAVPWPYTDAMAKLLGTDNCAGDAQKVKDNCKEDGSDQCPGSLAFTVGEQKAPLERKKGLPGRPIRAGEQATADAEGSECVKAMRCFLRPFEPHTDQTGCCPGQTPHHIPPKQMMKGEVAGYSEGQALCVCLEGSTQHTGSHGKNHAAIDYLAKKPGVLKNGRCSVRKYNEVCAKAVAAQCNCSKECIENQLNNSFTSKQLDKHVKHWESNSKQLDDLGPALDNIHVAPPAPPAPAF